VSNEKAPWLRTDDKDEQIRMLRKRIGELQKEVVASASVSAIKQDYMVLKRLHDAQVIQNAILRQELRSKKALLLRLLGWRR